MEGIPQRDRACKLQLDDGSLFSTKALGISWIALEDNFTFDSKFVCCDKRFTKRSLLKDVATLFDPLGFLSPFAIRAN